MRTLILRRLLLREVLRQRSPTKSTSACCCRPPTAPCWSTPPSRSPGRVACNLNYTVSAEVMNKCIAKAGIRHVLTSKKVMDKLGMKINAEVILLEDFKDKVTKADKLAGVAMAYATPVVAARSHAGPAPDERRRRADGHLHLRLHRRAEGGRAHAPQHRLERRSHRPGRPPPPRRHGARHRAVLPLAWLHGHAVDDPGARRAVRLSLLAARGAAGRQARQEVGRHRAARDADVPAELPAARASRRISPAGSRRRRRREAADPAVRRLRGKIRRPARRRLRHDRALAAGEREHPAQPLAIGRSRRARKAPSAGPSPASPRRSSTPKRSRTCPSKRPACCW